jgi:hypothetical protein
MVPSPQLRSTISELEEEERRLRAADRIFWENPSHDADASSDYEARRLRLIALRKELLELYKELLTVN